MPLAARLEPISTTPHTYELADASDDDTDSLQTPLQDPLGPAALPCVASTSPTFSPLLPPEHVTKLPFSPLSSDLHSLPMHSSCSSPSEIDPTGLSLHLPYDPRSIPSASTLFSPIPPHAPASHPPTPMYGHHYSPHFPHNHALDPEFARWYILGDELGAGGYGFVMTATHRLAGHEVAVKFIIKSKVPEHAWMDDTRGRSVPTEALLLGLLDHPNIVRCLDLFEDDLYFYLVQELHGTPWVAKNKGPCMVLPPTPPSSSGASTPALTPSPSISSDTPPTPPHSSPALSRVASGSSSSSSSHVHEQAIPPSKETAALEDVRPSFTRRPSHDLFECIEQSTHKRLTEAQARFIFAQIVEAVHYLDSQGVTHCDIKDENILVDESLQVKLIDFGSAVVVDPSEPRPLYTVFFGTTAYAASEVLQKKPYRAPPAEVWTLGVLLSYLLTGASPFPTERDAIKGRVVLHEKDGPGTCVSEEAEDLMLRCLEPDPTDRASIEEIRTHNWLCGALDLPSDQRVLS